jgi:ribosome maturation protein SDO1
MAVSIEKAVVARIIKNNQKFEILVDPKKALELKRGQSVSIEEILAYPAIYKDARTAEQASLQDLQKFFGTTDVYQIAEKIIKEGQVQLTAEQRKELIEQKKLQIATLISKRSINPQTNTPHPIQRILNVMEEVGINIDPFQDAEQQIDRVVKEIRKILPLRFEKITLRIKVGPQYCGKVYSILRNFGEVKNENWLQDGSYQVEIEILAGIQDELFEKIAKLTEGNFESAVVKREEI